MALHLIIASAAAVVRSSSLLLRRERPFQALVRSTTQRMRTALKPFVPGGGDSGPLRSANEQDVARANTLGSQLGNRAIDLVIRPIGM